MKKRKCAVKKIISSIVLFAIIISAFTACEEDFSDVGSDLVNNNNFNALLFSETEIDAFSVKVDRVQTNNSNNFLLGTYEDEVYGKTEANIASQLSLASADPSFGDDPVLDSVVLRIPYFSTPVDIDGQETIYELDSVYGNEPIDLSIYRSNYYLRSQDPTNNYEAQAYYSNQADLFEQNLEAQPIITLNNFVPSAEEIITTIPEEDENGEPTGETEVTRTAPALRDTLSTDYFTDLIINQEGTSNLRSNANFQDYFRGLYFKVESQTGAGNMSLLNLSSANITLYYTYSYTVNEENDEGEIEEVEREGQRQFILSFGSNRVNVFKNDFNELPADNKLHLKGGEGSMAVIDIFTNEAQLDSIREQGWLVNEANLKFYVDESAPQLEKQPYRLFVYDINNNSTLTDYTFDFSENANNPLYSRLIHLGPLDTINGNRFYKIRVTNLVNNIINNDSTNTRLGLSVSSNVNNTSLSKAEFDQEVDNLENLPNSGIFYPKGTVLYGTEPSDDSDKNLKLEIYYTEPK